MGNKNRTIEARVIFKAIDIINGNACHFITFEELKTKERVYLQVGIGNYMMIIEGDVGELIYKSQKKRYKSKFYSFQRFDYNKVEAALLSDTYSDELPVLDEGVRALLEAADAHEEVVIEAQDEKEAPVEEETSANDEKPSDAKEADTDSAQEEVVAEKVSKTPATNAKKKSGNKKAASAKSK